MLRCHGWDKSNSMLAAAVAQALAAAGAARFTVGVTDRLCVTSWYSVGRDAGDAGEVARVLEARSRRGGEGLWAVQAEVMKCLRREACAPGEGRACVCVCGRSVVDVYGVLR